MRELGDKMASHRYEFGGPLGAVLTMAGLTVLVPAFALACGPDGWPQLDDVAHRWALDDFAAALALVAAWIALHCALYVAVPGKVVEGCPLRDGRSLRYRLNGLACSAIAFAGVLFGHVAGWWSLVWIYDRWLSLSVAAVLVSWALAVALFFGSFRPSATLAHEHAPNLLYQFFMGRELNPRLLGVDLKYVCELRPGLLGWVIVNTAFALKQHDVHGRVTPEMVLVWLFQASYVLDALWNERCILSTMDITTDGFGWMLAFGDLAWVPFLYSLQARYLADFPQDMGSLQLGAAAALHATGYVVFRLSNLQKDRFRANPAHTAVKGLRKIRTPTGGSLLAGGWWGRARHINYLGDWLMSISWCMLTGTSSVAPYFYCVYFAVLLVHRERRDDAKCRRKYGKAWEEYCSRVPHRIVPYVY